ncbi:YlaF family protein [Metabacillus malikii]|nr:YlaF family protein [Metabacillus malikii]
MKAGKWIFLVLASLAALSMVGIGIAIGLKSLLGVIMSIIALNVIMASGFILKKKMRENGILD